MAEEKLLNDLLADIYICKKRGENRCKVEGNRLIHADVASIQINLEKLGYKTHVQENGIEISW